MAAKSILNCDILKCGGALSSVEEHFLHPEESLIRQAFFIKHF